MTANDDGDSGDDDNDNDDDEDGGGNCIAVFSLKVTISG